MKILAYLQSMAQSEILSMIDTAKYAEIRDNDPHPNFKAYVIGQEGEAKGKLVGMGKVAAQWFKSAIEKITNLLQIGTKVFHGHGQTNAQEGRQPIGEVVGKAIKNIGNKISSVAIMYLYPQYRDLPLNVASIEAEIMIPKNLEKGMKVADADVQNITGIALGNSALEKPAFPGAVKLGELQAFLSSSYQGGSEMTIEEVKQFLNENPSTKLSDLVSIGRLSEDPAVKRLIEDGYYNVKNARERNVKEWEEDKKEWTEKNKNLQKKLDEQLKINLKIQAKEKIETIIQQRKIEDEKQIAFIKKDIDSFDPTEEKTLESDLNKFVDTKLDDYDKTLEALGLKKEGGKEEKGGGAPPGKEEQTDEDENLANPEKNDFIPDY